MKYLSPFILLILTVLPGSATTVDFEAQAAGRGGSLTGTPDSPLTIGSATFTGGELLNGEVGLNADGTGVYATQGLFGSGETNPLVIAFTTPVQDLTLWLLNGDDTRSYTISDNLGDSITKSLPSAGALGEATLSLVGSGITSVEITSANTDAWDFAIDNVTYTLVTETPEPASLLLAGAGITLLAMFNRKRFQLKRQYSISRTNSLKSPAFTSDTAQ
jgi:PEP-CTERM motif